MKKNLLQKLLLLTISLVLVFALVACDDKDEGKSNENNGSVEELKPITLTENMTLDEVRAALKDVKNFKQEWNYDDVYGDVKETHYWCENGGVAYYNDGRGDQYMIVIIEDNVFYCLECEYNEDLGKFTYEEEIVNAKEYEVASDLSLNNLKQELEWYLYDVMTEEEWEIENGQIVIYYDDGDIDKMYDFNCTETYIPEYYVNYKNLKPTKEIAEYYYTDEEENAILLGINGYLKSFDVPESYKGKPVKAVYFENQNNEMLSSEGWFKSYRTLEEITVPKSVTMMMGLGYYENLKTINYLGTQEEWSKVSVSSRGISIIGSVTLKTYTVNCTDGTITIEK